MLTGNKVLYKACECILKGSNPCSLVHHFAGRYYKNSTSAMWKDKVVPYKSSKGEKKFSLTALSKRLENVFTEREQYIPLWRSKYNELKQDRSDLVYDELLGKMVMRSEPVEYEL